MSSNIKEDAPTNSMGASSSTAGLGPIDTYDPLLKTKRGKPMTFHRFIKTKKVKSNANDAKSAPGS